MYVAKKASHNVFICVCLTVTMLQSCCYYTLTICLALHKCKTKSCKNLWDATLPTNADKNLMKTDNYLSELLRIYFHICIPVSSHGIGSNNESLIRLGVLVCS